MTRFYTALPHWGLKVVLDCNGRGAPQEGDIFFQDPPHCVATDDFTFQACRAGFGCGDIDAIEAILELSRRIRVVCAYRK